MCADMCADMCVGMCIDMCVDIYVCRHVYRHACRHVCRHVRRHVYGHVFIFSAVREIHEAITAGGSGPATAHFMDSKLLAHTEANNAHARRCLWHRPKAGRVLGGCASDDVSADLCGPFTIPAFNGPPGSSRSSPAAQRATVADPGRPQVRCARLATPSTARLVPPPIALQFHRPARRTEAVRRCHYMTSLAVRSVARSTVPTSAFVGSLQLSWTWQGPCHADVVDRGSSRARLRRRRRRRRRVYCL